MEPILIRFGTPQPLRFCEDLSPLKDQLTSLEFYVAGTATVTDYNRAVFGDPAALTAKLRELTPSLLEVCILQWRDSGRFLRWEPCKKLAKAFRDELETLEITAQVEITSVRPTAEAQKLLDAAEEKKEELLRSLPRDGFYDPTTNEGQPRQDREFPEFRMRGMQPDCILNMNPERFPTQPNKETDKFCRSCGQKRSPGAKFCTNCAAQFG